MEKIKKSVWIRWYMIVLYVFVGLIIVGAIGNNADKKVVDSQIKETVKETPVTPKTTVSTTEKLTDLQKQMKALQRVDDCSIICSGKDKDILAIKNEWYMSCNQIYYNLGIEELEKFITNCANKTTT